MKNDHDYETPVLRREFLATTAGTAVLLTDLAAFGAEEQLGPYFATSTRVGEVTENSAIVTALRTVAKQRWSECGGEIRE